MVFFLSFFLELANPFAGLYFLEWLPHKDHIYYFSSDLIETWEDAQVRSYVYLLIHKHLHRVLNWLPHLKTSLTKNADIKECFVVFVFVFFWGGEGGILFFLQFIRLEKPNRWYQVSPKQHKNKIQH